MTLGVVIVIRLQPMCYFFDVEQEDIIFFAGLR